METMGLNGSPHMLNEPPRRLRWGIKNNALRAGVLLLAITLLGGCGGNTGTSSGSKITKSGGTVSAVSVPASISLPYAMNRSMNPFTADTMINFNLMPLLYDTLVEPDNNLQAQSRLATAANVSGTTVILNLRTGVRFSDGTPLTSKDVTYSFGCVLGNGSSPYASRVSNILSVTANGDYQVVFHLKSPDPLALNMLDVPIVKNQTGGVAHPVGSGRYVYKSLGNSTVLTWNKSWYGGANPKVQAITLVNMPDDATIATSLDIGTIDYMLSDYGTTAMTIINKSSTYLNLNQLLFMGVNRNNKVLADVHVRCAISALLDRASIVQNIYSSQAKATVLPFNPMYSGVPPTQAASLSSRVDVASAELTKAGYTTKNSVGVLQNDKDKSLTLSFTLFVNKGDSRRSAAAQKISDLLQPAGILVKVTAVDERTFQMHLAARQFDLFLGEIKLPEDLDVSALIVPGAAASYGQPASGSFYQAYEKYRAGQSDLQTACKAFADEMPFIPLCFRLGTASYAANFCSNIIATSHDIFYNIQDWK